MNAEDLFNESKKLRRKYNKYGMSNRAFLIACRRDLANRDTGINIPRMLDAIKSGEVWSMREVGEKTVKEWCDWLAAQQSVQADKCPSCAGTGTYSSHVFTMDYPDCDGTDIHR